MATVAGSERARPPYELRPGTGRHGPHELWTQFDAAVEQLNAAGGGDCVTDVVPAYTAVADAARALADALEAAGEQQTPWRANLRRRLSAQRSDRSAVPAEHVVRDRNALKRE